MAAESGDALRQQAAAGPSSGWHLMRESLARPYRMSWAMVMLMLLVPLYVFIPILNAGRPLHRPELAWDRAFPVVPAWTLVYGALYLYLILLPVFVVRQPAHIRRAFQAYLMVWLTAYTCFMVYPTIAARPEEVAGAGFLPWAMRMLYAADPPYNCFPSIHVAHSFVSALACRRVHRGLGFAATVCAALVGLSTLYTKQHYLLDVMFGILLAGAAWALFLRRIPEEEIPELDRHAAPALAMGVTGIVALVFAGYGAAYLAGVEP